MDKISEKRVLMLPFRKAFNKNGEIVMDARGKIVAGNLRKKDADFIFNACNAFAPDGIVSKLVGICKCTIKVSSGLKKIAEAVSVKIGESPPETPSIDRLIEEASKVLTEAKEIL